MFQAPSNIPTLFKGDKVVIYGILKSKAGSDDPLQSGVQGKASLKGHISGESFTHSISFDVPAPPLLGEDQLESSTGFDIPVIHHLAAKSLLSDWKAGKGWSSTALTLEREQESTNLSIESSVICEHTAFVAVDKEQNKQINGAITLIDISATIVGKESGHKCRCFGVRTGGARKKKSKSAPREQKEMGTDSWLSKGGGRGGPVLCSRARPAVSHWSLGSSERTSDMMLNSLGTAEDEDYLSVMAKSSKPALSEPRSAMMPHSLGTAEDEDYLSVIPKLSKPALSSDSLTNLISFQHASGFWNLKDISEKLVKKPEVESQCPSNVSKEVWATILALAYLELNYSKQKDEWELVAMKAEMWLGSQTLPASLEELTKRAKTLL